MKYIDICAGIGGLSSPFYHGGHKCVMISEIDKFAIKTYEKNYTHSDGFNCGDITQIRAIEVPDHDILLAGFPCPSFSVAGKRLGFADIRGTVIFKLVEILKVRQPDCFLLENVKGLVNHDNGNTLRIILEELNSAGYNIHYKVLKAEEFGLPQTRHRIYFVGFRDDIDNSNFKFPEPLNTETSLWDVCNTPGMTDEKYNLSAKMWNYLRDRKEQQKAKGNGFGYNLYCNSYCEEDTSKVVGTLSARYGKDGSEILIQDIPLNIQFEPEDIPLQSVIRKLTPRECARLMGFSDTFDITACSDTQLYKQFGNSVCIPVVNAIYNKMMEIVGENNRDNEVYFHTPDTYSN